MYNFTQSMGFAVLNPDGTTSFKYIAEAYQDALDLAQLQVSTGVFDYNTAIRNAVRTLTDSGLCFVDYASGHKNRLDVAVRRAVLTGVSQMTGRISEQNAAELETDIVEVTAHAGARPDHAEWQGGWYSLSGKSKVYKSLVAVTGYGTGAGLKGWNCHHDFYPVIPGYSVPAYTEEELKNIDPDPIEYNGKTLTYYDCTQMQRKMETAMRKTKRQIMGFKAAGDEDMFTAKSVRLRLQQEQYKEFSKKTNLLTQNERTQVYGFDRSIASKASWAARKAESQTAKKIDKAIDKVGGKGYNKTGSGIVALENQRYGRNKNTTVNKSYIDSGEYRRKFDNATDNPAVNKTLYDCAKKALKHRSGTIFEDMYWIDGDSGEIILSVTDSTLEHGIAYTDKIKETIKNRDNIITLHTHPSSMPPSGSDFTSNFDYNYKTGFVACHNGKVFGYLSNEPINERIYEMYIQEFKKDGYDEYNAQLNALEKISQAFDISVWEVNYYE